MTIPLYGFTTKDIEMVQNNSRNHYDSIVPIFAGGHARLEHPRMHTQATKYHRDRLRLVPILGTNMAINHGR